MFYLQLSNLIHFGLTFCELDLQLGCFESSPLTVMRHPGELFQNGRKGSHSSARDSGRTLGELWFKKRLSPKTHVQEMAPNSKTNSGNGSNKQTTSKMFSKWIEHTTNNVHETGPLNKQTNMFWKRIKKGTTPTMLTKLVHKDK